MSSIVGFVDFPLVRDVLATVRKYDQRRAQIPIDGGSDCIHRYGRHRTGRPPCPAGRECHTIQMLCEKGGPAVPKTGSTQP